MLLRLTSISKTYDACTVLKNISLEISSKSITLLTGPNGAGKTTLLAIMAGLTKPTTGSITFSCTLNELGYLGHHTCIYPKLSALENLTFWGRLYNRPTIKNKLEAILARVDLTKFIHEPAGTFSRGMSQRLNLARILLIKPKLLLLDEPGTGLDLHSIEMLHNEVIQAKNAGAGIVWVSHDVDTDIHSADNILVLDNKILEYFGPVKQYMQKLQQYRTSYGSHSYDKNSSYNNA